MSVQRVVVVAVCILFVKEVAAEQICSDPEWFNKSGWQETIVQQAMDDYLRDHRMRVNWLKEPRPPDSIGKSYYEWLWSSGFGSEMKSELVARFCRE